MSPDFMGSGKLNEILKNHPEDTGDDVTERARLFATRAHDGQVRKYTGEPYIVHPIAVAGLVRSVDLDDEVVAAAFLHDVVEDCGVGIEEIAGRFGSRVAKFVGEVTNVSKPEDGNREARKALDRAHLAKASPEGMSIKLADMLDNSRSIIPRDPGFARVYLREMQLVLPGLTDGNPVLWSRVSAVVENFMTGR